MYEGTEKDTGRRLTLVGTRFSHAQPSPRICSPLSRRERPAGEDHSAKSTHPKSQPRSAAGHRWLLAGVPGAGPAAAGAPWVSSLALTLARVLPLEKSQTHPSPR